jgi:hypothetical protein
MNTSRLRKSLPIMALISAPLLAQAPEELRVRLTSPLTTKLNRAGDLVVARILQPPEYAGGYLEGEVREVHAGSAARKATLDFQFHSLHLPGKESRVSVGVVKIVNSRHQPDMDEDGTAIEQEKGAGAKAGLSHISSGIMSHIPKKGEKPEKTEKQTGPPPVLVKLAVKASSLSLAVGSELTVQFLSSATK